MAVKSRIRFVRISYGAAGLAVIIALSQLGAAVAQEGAPTKRDASAFLADAEAELDAATELASRADWVRATNITPDSDWLSGKTRDDLAVLTMRLAKKAALFDSAAVADEDRRKLDLLKRLAVVPPPSDARQATRLAQLQITLSSNYATGAFEFRGHRFSLGEAEAALAKSRDPLETLALWEGWRDAARRLKYDYVEMVDLSRPGARELGMADMGALWRSGYDRSPEAVEEDIERNWTELKPLYEALHCFARARLSEKYGAAVQPATGPIRADLLGNMWGQNWGNIIDIIYPEGTAGPDIDAALARAEYEPVRMVKTAEAFYVSLGLGPLPPSFWETSQFVRPAGRSVDCNPSAWSIDSRDDVRIKMCLTVTRQQFKTVFHELGHNYYNLAYKNQPFLFKNGADAGFQEGIGDFIALSSVTPEYYQKIGLLPPGAAKGDEIGALLQRALDEVPLIPFAIAVDKWRWDVLAGRTAPAEYNRSWWKTVLEYQGMAPARARPDDGFDAGAKYHIAENVPYISYLKARLYQYQFHEAACRMAKWKGPLHRCSIYGNKEVGARLKQMLALGASRPNSEALALFTGKSDADPKAMLRVYAPLFQWLNKRNEGRQCGW
jgi:peptidyl-dipeptidase A